jgi:diguanylate cyclase (GGDEF)-like protein/PAS domain S-box-containing protein
VADSADFLLTALERCSDAMAVIGADLRIRRLNAAAEHLFRCRRAELIGCKVRRLDRALRRLPFKQLMSGSPSGTSEAAPSELILQHADGSHSRISVSLSWVTSEDGGRFVLLARNITDDVEQRERVALLSTVSDRSNRAIIVTDHERRVIYVNASFVAMFGYSAEEAKGRLVRDLLASPHLDRGAIARLEQGLNAACGAEEELLLQDKHGQEIWVAAFVEAHRNARGEIRQMFGLLSDISETKQLRSLQQLTTAGLAEERPLEDVADQLCRRVEELAPGIVCSILHVDKDGLLHPLGGPSLAADYCAALDGLAIGPEIGCCGTAAYLGEPVLALDIETDPRWEQFKTRPLEMGLRACWSTPIKARDGRAIGTFAFYFRESRGPSRWHQQIVDACTVLSALAIERHEARAAMARIAFHDMLTGLPNRARIPGLIAEAIGACAEGSHVAVAFLDADNFKDVNDTLGHAAGDEFLVAFARRLRGQIKPGDMLGRLGGDEFVIVLPNRDAVEASLMAAQITAALATPLTIGKRQVVMSASMGLSLYPDNATDIDTLIKQADAAMYKAKHAGRATYRFFSADMNKIAEQRLMTSTALRQAIAEEALTLHYQPQIRSSDGTIHGVEALARWHDPVLGEVSPAKFIPLAEECGLIEQIGIWSIREACRQMAVWRRAGLDIPAVSVNLSPINFQNVNLAAQVALILAKHELQPNHLILEITEGVFLSERSTVIATMGELRRLGVGLSLDDFGTGYSSLSRLAQLPIDELKIDRSFMRDLVTDTGTRAIVTAVVRVGQSLNLAVVAEGVETDAQRALLVELGCDAIQGFFSARPLPATAFGRWLLDYSAHRASAMLRQIRNALAQSDAASSNWVAELG